MHENHLKLMEFLLAVDLGVKTGFSVFNSEGKLVWYQSRNFGNRKRLKEAIPEIIQRFDPLTHLFMEGGGEMGEIWTRATQYNRLEVAMIHAEEWRKDLFYPRELTHKRELKIKARHYAEKVIKTLGIQKFLKPDADAAEAILIGLWAAWKLGWVKDVGFIH